MMEYQIRKSNLGDFDGLQSLYKKVASTEGGLARTEKEISETYISNFMSKSLQSGLQFVIVHPERPDVLIGEIHTYAIGPKVFAHVLGELTIAIDPDFQGMGLGRMLFQKLLETIKLERTDILRVELIARESNTKAIQFYQSLGFIIEGKLDNRIRSANGTLEADIPMAWFNPNYKHQLIRDESL